MLSDTTLKQTPLYQEHLNLKAKMVPFGGWEMPLQYEGIIAEYQDTRKGVTIFDTSHMGEFIVEAYPSHLSLPHVEVALILPRRVGEAHRRPVEGDVHGAGAAVAVFGDDHLGEAADALESA